MIRHHERDFAEFERIDASPEEFYAERGEADAADAASPTEAPPGEAETADDAEESEGASSGAADD